MDFKFGVLLVLGAYICSSQALPPCTCARNYTPVCGSNGETYSNMCLLECAQFNGQKDLNAVKDGPCDNEPKIEVCICSYIYLPVCGTDSVTYPNQCSLECEMKRVAGLQKSHDGQCVLPADPPCECTRKKEPVCGSDGNTYSNDCMLNCATKNNNMLSIAHYGPCEDKVKVAEIH